MGWLGLGLVSSFVCSIVRVWALSPCLVSPASSNNTRSTPLFSMNVPPLIAHNRENPTRTRASWLGEVNVFGAGQGGYLWGHGLAG